MKRRFEAHDKPRLSKSDSISRGHDYTHKDIRQGFQTASIRQDVVRSAVQHGPVSVDHARYTLCNRYPSQRAQDPPLAGQGFNEAASGRRMPQKIDRSALPQHYYGTALPRPASLCPCNDSIPGRNPRRSLPPPSSVTQKSGTPPPSATASPPPGRRRDPDLTSTTHI